MNSIYITGDSITDGTGLGDHILPDYPGDIPFNKLNDKKFDDRSSWMEKVYNDPNFNKIRDYGKQLSWAGLLEKKLNIKIINGSYPGSTLTSIFIRMISDFENLKDISNVIISLPNLYRIPLILKNQDTVEKTFLSITASNLSLYSINQQQLAKTYWTEFDGESCLIFYLKDLISIRHYVKSKTNKFPLIVDSMFFNQIKEIYDLRELKITENLWKESEIENNIKMNQIIDKDDYYVADGHYGHNIHKKFADYLINFL